MEPLLGGNLATPPPAVQALWDSAQKNPVETALHWIWDKPEVTTVLSGMSTLEQVQQNIGYAESSGVGKFTHDDHNLIARVKETYDTYETIPCTKCHYCMPCPSGVNIPRNLQMYNHFAVHNRIESAQYFFLTEEQRASACVACHACEDMCPQKIAISEWMPRIHERLTRGGFGKWADDWRKEL